MEQTKLTPIDCRKHLVKKLGTAECAKAFTIDPLMSMAANRPVYDIYHFEDYCASCGMRDDESMEDYIIRKYGENCLPYIMNMLGL